jgi:hypothetical protein
MVRRAMRLDSNTAPMALSAAPMVRRAMRLGARNNVAHAGFWTVAAAGRPPARVSERDGVLS